jgi:hypothetical protein
MLSTRAGVENDAALARGVVGEYLLEMAGETEAAIEHSLRLLPQRPNLPEQHYLASKAAQLRAESAASGEPAPRLSVWIHRRVADDIPHDPLAGPVKVGCG